MLVLGIISNFVIFAGYVFIGWKIAPAFKLRFITTKIGAIAFFVTCGLTHLHMAISAWMHMPMDYTSWYYLVNHVVQAIAVWVFPIGLFIEMILLPKQAAKLDLTKDESQ